MTTEVQPRSRHKLLKTLLTVSLVSIFAAVGFLLIAKPHHAAAATANGCTVPTGGGTDSFDNANGATPSNGIDVQSAGTYYLWLRMESPDGTHNSLQVSIDGGSCITIGGTMAANAWTWENNESGTTTAYAVNFTTTGYHTMVVTGANGMSLDTFLFTQQTPSQCTPTGITSATDCQPQYPVTVPYYMSAGNPANVVTGTGSTAITWNADTLSPASSYLTTTGSSTDCQLSSTQTITNADGLQQIYACERWDGTGFSYTIPVQNGKYQLNLYFAEISAAVNATGLREFNVVVNGVTEATNLDLVKTVGQYAAYIMPVTVTVTNNQIVASFTTGAENAPKLSGLAILSSSPTVSISAPVANTTVSGTAVGLTAAAADVGGVSQVQFKVDGVAVGPPATTSPYKATWDTTPYTNAAHSITAVVTNTSGISVTSNAVSVTVANDTCTGTPTVPSAVTTSAVTASAVTLKWTAGAAATNCTLAGYNVYRGTSATNMTKINTATVTGVTYTDTTAAANTPYYYAVTSLDSTGTAPESAKVDAATFPVTTAQNCTSNSTSLPTTPTLTATGGTSYTSIGLSWSVSTVSNGCTLSGYHVYRTGTTTPIYTGPATSFTDTGVGLTPANLTSGTAYNYTVQAYDSGGNNSVAGSASATTEKDNDAPLLPSTPVASNITSGGDTLTWGASTDLPNPGGTGVGGYEIYRCTGANCSTFTNLIANVPSTQLTYTDTSVSPSTTYDYIVIAYDKASPINYDNTASATIVPVVIPAAAVSCTADPGVVTLSQGTTTYTSIGLTWTASTPASGCTISGYQVWKNGAQYNSYGATTRTASVTGLTSGQSYSFYVVALESSTLTSQSTTHSFTTSVNTTPPTPPTGFTATNLNGAVTLSWTASTDNIGVTDYVITRTGGAGTVILPAVDSPTTSTTDSSVSASTAYTYSIVAYDTVGLPSSTVTTTDTTPPPTCSGTPTAPSKPVSSALTANGATFTWTAGSVPSGCTVAGYRVFNGTTLISGSSLVTTPSFTINTLTPSTQYSFNVEEVDSSNVASAASTSLVETTSTAGTTAIGGDINGDGSVDGRDFTIFVIHWGALSTIPNYTSGEVTTTGETVTGDPTFDNQAVTANNAPTLFTHFVIDWGAYDGT
jgi:hypothetical protein